MRVKRKCSRSTDTSVIDPVSDIRSVQSSRVLLLLAGKSGILTHSGRFSCAVLKSFGGRRDEFVKYFTRHASTHLVLFIVFHFVRTVPVRTVLINREAYEDEETFCDEASTIGHNCTRYGFRSRCACR